MRTSKFYSPLHPTKVVDISSELVSTLYYNNKLNETCDIFSYLYDNVITIQGVISANDHPTDGQIIEYVRHNIETDYDIRLNIKKNNNFIGTDANILNETFLGYACSENDQYLPFEHSNAKLLTRAIYNEYNIPIGCQLNINGNSINLTLEHNFKNTSELENFIFEFYTQNLNKSKVEINIFHDDINYNKLYKSGEYAIYNLYGPRVPHGNVSFVGTEVMSNKRISILIARILAKRYLEKEHMRYSLVELSYGNNLSTPIQIGIKGNISGIHIENGTFFTFGSIDEVNSIKHDIISHDVDIIEFTRWGIL
jgi:S-adenosylmethionine synthetase